MTDIKLLTEAEVRGYFKHNPCADVDAIIESFRERGLIAEEPVDPLLVEAREIAAQANRDAGNPNYAHGVLEGRYDKGTDVRSALAALRRGMELQREKLTRGIFDAATEAAVADWRTTTRRNNYNAFYDHLFRALLERLS